MGTPSLVWDLPSFTGTGFFGQQLIAVILAWKSALGAQLASLFGLCFMRAVPLFPMFIMLITAIILVFLFLLKAYEAHKAKVLSSFRGAPLRFP